VPRSRRHHQRHWGDDDTLKDQHVVCGDEFIQAELVKILKPLGT
jgi:hypothetical protein